MILLVVLVVLSMLTFAGLAIVINISTETRAFVYESNRLQLEQVLLSGVEYLKAFCEKTPAEQFAAGGPDDNPARFSRVPVAAPGGSAPLGYFSVLAPRQEADPSTPGGRFGLQSENAKLNLRTLLLWEETGIARARDALMLLPGMTESVADSILDWVDADESRRPYGAEADYYATQRLPYRPRNDVPVAIEELLLVRGVERYLLIGATFGQPSSAGLSLVTGGGGQSEATAWVNYITPYSGERNVSSDGLPRINLNDPELARLHQRIAQAFTEEIADFVVFYRQFGPATEEVDSLSDAQAAPGDLAPDFSRSAAHAFRSVFDILDASVEVEVAGRDRVVVRSPLSADPELVRQHLSNWIDRTTTTADRVLYGRIDITRAPREVLLAIPGMDSTVAERILALRQQGTSGGEESPLARLYFEGAISAEQLRQLGPFVTTRTDVWTAEIVAEDAGNPNLRLRAVVTVDATAVPARQVYWKHMGSGPST
ncbi:MAG: general secretion pathway protein GspK [Thermoguttaceae bacterium]|nr:general secretion pathway protein GspK [Thermoguttaceae bacterium]MDW8079668.1 type II secretion system protein GspK [Thermoguttaceae bacterium]